ncbi:disintegrin and metalloproteinase domain-containing protein 1b-like [Mastomys coucha]|uniref:disintegrin and metalloproteinase domain-containing protein 1b-like n=1 Tax=Mastomys coucha TaxID=35658 RepID=UPI0012624BE8|nr:disintegrin and metalloproteinase domain-containing protein 1b-like [Mastomys coucha]
MERLKLGQIPEHLCIRLVAMLLLAIVFLPSTFCDIGSVYNSSYETVIPERLPGKGSEDPGGKVSYMLLIQGQKQLLHLEVKGPYSENNFPVYIYHNGILGQEMPPLSQDCHYEGYMVGVPGSFVSVNICSGLRGVLIKEETSYSIEPMLSSKNFEHVLYTMDHQPMVSCRVTPEDSPGNTSHQQRSRKPDDLLVLSDLWSHTKYVEMFVVVNHQRFQMWGNNVNKTVQVVVDIIALANSFIRGINTEVVLVGLEIWSEGDPIEHDHSGDCLLDEPWRQSRKRRATNCGNGMVEDLEQCDCGSDCDKSQCCDNDCKLKGDSQCSDELCCFQCKFKKKGDVCRPADGPCDLEEYCNGTSAKCPEDRIAQDGSVCHGTFFCFEGKCMDPSFQCSRVFGYGAKSAPDNCYTSLNTRGDRFGNCGFSSDNPRNYNKCSDQNTMCGKLICTEVAFLPQIKHNHMLIQVPQVEDWCWSLDMSDKEGALDEGHVRNKTYCGRDKVCENSICKDFTIPQQPCNPRGQCHEHGVCNDLGNCHCSFGFEPPDCKNEGAGGSVDSGPPVSMPDDNTTGQNSTQSSTEELILNLKLIVLAVILVLMILLIIICVITAYSRSEPASEAEPSELEEVPEREEEEEEEVLPEEAEKEEEEEEEELEIKEEAAEEEAVEKEGSEEANVEEEEAENTDNLEEEGEE